MAGDRPAGTWRHDCKAVSRLGLLGSDGRVRVPSAPRLNQPRPEQGLGCSCLRTRPHCGSRQGAGLHPRVAVVASWGFFRHDPIGMTRLERTFVVSAGGWCRFCGQPRRDVRAVVEVVGAEAQICDECIGVCWDVIEGELGADLRPNDSWLQREALPELPSVDDETVERERAAFERFRAEVEARATAALSAREMEAREARRKALHESRLAELASARCSFCDASREEVRKLVSGPRHHVCDACVSDATTVITEALRA